jgi:hypothetical protein
MLGMVRCIGHHQNPIPFHRQPAQAFIQEDFIIFAQEIRGHPPLGPEAQGFAPRFEEENNPHGMQAPYHLQYSTQRFVEHCIQIVGLGKGQRYGMDRLQFLYNALP